MLQTDIPQGLVRDNGSPSGLDHNSPSDQSGSWRLCLLVLFVLLSIESRQVVAADDSYSTLVAPFLKRHCYDCHGAEKQEALIRYDQIDRFRAGDRHLWTMVHEKLAAGEMPPKGRPQPAAAEKKQVLTWIEAQQRSLVTGSTRRLNRRELSAALRDVTGLSVDYALAMPGDGKVAGFDTGAEGLHDSADSVAQGLRITRRAVDGIRILEPSPGKVLRANLRESKDVRKTLDEWKAEGVSAKVPGLSRLGNGLLLEPSWVGDRSGFSLNIPQAANRAGIVRLKLVVSVLKPVAGVPHPRLWVEIGRQDIDYREITGTLEQPQQLVYEVQLNDLAIDSKGLNITLSNKVELPYAIEGFENDDRSSPDKPVPGGTGLFRPVFDKKTLPPEKQPVPFVVLQQIEIESNYVAPWPPATWQVDLGKIQDDPDSAQRLLNLWIERAWRRPTTAAERERFLSLYRQLRTQGVSFDAALRAAFQSVLLSAPFRYLAAPVEADAVVAQHAIASRLSFMLGGEPPDAELLRLAAAGKLRDSTILDGQVDRLLADSRSAGFVRPFVTQWLEAEQPITLAMSHIQKQDFRFGRYLKASMRDETVAYIAQLLADNRPARELVESDWTMMNDILAIHYGYAGIEGGELRKVKLRADDPRGGGILGHAGIQSMLCWMGDNWVIYRGAWALRHILDLPPPPPPLEVPELRPSDAENRGKTFRELLKQHQADTRCSVCHKHMDPLGFAFQNFDLSGRWRDVEHESYARSELDGKIAWQGVGKTRPVDATGHLPRGEQFRNYAEFKQLVVKHYQADMVRGLMKNFMIYATGRKPDVADLRDIGQIMRDQEPRGYPLRDVLKAIVRSPAFLDR